MNLSTEFFIRCYSKPIGQTSLLSTQEPTAGITPSLATLNDAQALRRKEWKSSEPSKDMHRQYSTVSWHLMPTPPKHEDMRMDSTLDVTPEGSLSDIQAAVGGVEEHGRELATHQTSEEKLQEVSPSTGGSCLSQILWEHENQSGLLVIWLIYIKLYRKKETKFWGKKYGLSGNLA